MRVVVQLMRSEGVARAAVGSVHQVAGQLRYQRLIVHGHEVNALELIGSDRPVKPLYDPRLMHISDGRMRFLGYERNDPAWTLQEWWCEVR